MDSPLKSRPLEPDRPLITRAAVGQYAPIETLHARFVRQRFTRHTHDQFAIGVVEQGAHAFERGRSRFQSGPGLVIVNNPGDVHTGQAVDDRGWTYRMFYPDPRVIADLMSDLRGSHRAGLPGFIAPVIDDPALADTIRAAHRAAHRAAGGVRAGAVPTEFETRFLHMIDRLLPHCETAASLPRGNRDTAAVARACAYLVDHLDAPVSLDDLVAVTGLSRFQLLRAFAAERGMPPYAWLIAVRISRARALLADGVPVVDVASATGFFDQSHLTRHFRRLTGSTPSAYQRMIRA